MAAARFDSESSRNVAEATTSSPGFKPATISTRESPRTPTRTSRGTNRPSPRFTKTRSLVPVGSTASSGTLTPPLPRPAVASTAVAYIPGREAVDLVGRDVPQGAPAPGRCGERVIFETARQAIFRLCTHQIGRIGCQQWVALLVAPANVIRVQTLQPAADPRIDVGEVGFG